MGKLEDMHFLPLIHNFHKATVGCGPSDGQISNTRATNERYGHSFSKIPFGSMIGTVSCHASGPPKRLITKLLGVKMKLESNENCIGLKFSPLLIMEANLSPIGQLLYK